MIRAVKTSMCGVIGRMGIFIGIMKLRILYNHLVKTFIKASFIELAPNYYNRSIYYKYIANFIPYY